MLNSLAEIKKISKRDLHQFLQLNHTSFTTFNVSCKDIKETNLITINLSKPSARSFYLNKHLNNSIAKPKVDLKGDCCEYFINRDVLGLDFSEHGEIAKEKKLLRKVRHI